MLKKMIGLILVFLIGGSVLFAQSVDMEKNVTKTIEQASKQEVKQESNEKYLPLTVLLNYDSTKANLISSQQAKSELDYYIKSGKLNENDLIKAETIYNKLK